jgi:hypothetical protein
MPALVQFLVAERIVVDRFSDDMAVFNIIDELSVGKEETFLDKIACLTILRREEGEDSERDEQLVVRVVLPSDESRDLRKNFKFGRPTMKRVIQRISGVPIDRPGFLRFEVSLNGRHLFSTAVPVFAETAPKG